MEIVENVEFCGKPSKDVEKPVETVENREKTETAKKTVDKQYSPVSLYFRVKSP